jgi:hypothetical protein
MAALQRPSVIGRRCVTVPLRAYALTSRIADQGAPHKPLVILANPDGGQP